MEKVLLHVLHFTLSGKSEIAAILRAARQTCPKDERRSILLLGDLCDADAEILPQDTPMLQKLQSGVMTMNARSENEFLLLVRRRVWDDAARAFLGNSQRTSIREIVAQLIRNGETDAVFSAATVSPSSLRDRFSCILFSEISLACTPDTPAKMADALAHTGAGCLCVRPLEMKTFPQTSLSRLCAGGPFSLSPLLCAKEDRLLRKGQCLTSAPAIYTAEALTASITAPIPSAPAAPDCCFVRKQRFTLPEFFHAHRRLCLHGRVIHAALPIVQLMLLFLCAGTGLSFITVFALLPEIHALIHPSLLPGALLRLALMPLTACASLDALLCRALAHSRLIRLHIPDFLITPQGCALFGAILLPTAMVSAQALVPLLPVSLLWLGAPLIIPALDAPTIERIPLSGDQLKQMKTFAESAFFDCTEAICPPSMRMLAACAGCMLGLLEPDEAARQIQSQLDALKDRPLSAHELAASLACAQFLRERMGDCDAALRGLPTEIEHRALALPLNPVPGKLRALLSAAKQASTTKQALEQMAKCAHPEPTDLLFLPMLRSKDTPLYSVSLPLTHPHTFLKRQSLASDTRTRPSESVLRFLFLCAATLDHPFHALLERSPVTGPYMVLLSI